MKMNMKLPFSFALKRDFKSLIQYRSWIGCFYIVCIIPAVFFFFHILHLNSQFKEWKNRIENLQIRIERMKTIQKNRNNFVLKYSDVDPYYIDNVLESMSLLKSEVEALNLIYSHPAFQACDNVKKRLDTLTKGTNRLIFSEKKRKSENGIEEVEYVQAHSVEINVSDLKAILAAIEGIKVENYTPLQLGRPQFIIPRFHLTKNRLAERETYLLEMHLIKRGVTK